MPGDFDPSDLATDFRSNVNARASQMLYDSGFGQAGRAISKAADTATRAVGDTYNAAKERFFPTRPDAAGPGRDIQLPRDRHSKRNFNPERERRR